MNIPNKGTRNPNLRTQRGFAFLPFLLANWQLIAIGALALTVWGYYTHCQSIKRDHAQLIAKLEVQAEAARQDAERKIQEGRKAKERADEDHKRTVARLNRDVKRLRESRSGAGYVPPAPAGSPSPDRATFDRAELERAIRRLDEGVSGLLAEGDSAVAGLDTAKNWAQGR